jgi:hypothetical protein
MNAYKFLVGISEGDPLCRLKDNIKVDFKELGCEVIDFDLSRSE